LPPVHDDALLDALEQEAIHVIREAYACLRPLALLWSTGKDSTTLLWLTRKAFLGRVPVPVVLLDMGNEFDEVYAFRDRMIAEWGLDHVNVECPPAAETDPSLSAGSRAAARKTLGLTRAIAQLGLRGVMLGIRRDEHPVRSKERLFSPRTRAGTWDFRRQPVELWGHHQMEVPVGAHVRVHPLLGWTEMDVWRYIRREGIPVAPLYYARDGMRFRSLGARDVAFPVPSSASSIDEIIAELAATNEPERAGGVRAQESEDAFERLRVAGYL
jgi:sulfate adenylyltransferase subunit 2